MCARAPIPFIFRWLPFYDWRESFGRDLLAAAIIAIIVIPQGLAYAQLAGLNPVYGIYAGIFPAVVYVSVYKYLS